MVVQVLKAIFNHYMHDGFYKIETIVTVSVVICINDYADVLIGISAEQM